MAKSGNYNDARSKIVSTHPIFGGDDKKVSDEYLPWETDSYGGYVAEKYFDSKGSNQDVPDRAILYVPGNTGTSEHFDHIARRLLDAGYDGDRLYAINPLQTTPTAEEYAAQQADFIPRMLDNAGTDSFAVVSESYGPPAAWKTIHEEDRYDELDAFVSIAGALNGTATADIGNLIGLGYASPEFITRRSAEYGELGRLREESDLTYHADVLTMSSEIDKCFAPMNENFPRLNFTPAVFHSRFYEDNRDSPMLEGARNLVWPDLKHNDFRSNEIVIDEIEDFLIE